MLTLRLALLGDPPAGYARRLADAAPGTDVVTRIGPDCDAVVLWDHPPDVLTALIRATVAGAPTAAAPGRLRWIGQRSVGVAPGLCAALTGTPVVLTNGRGGHGAAIAEYVAAVVLAHLKRLPQLGRAQVRRRWRADLAPCELAGRTVGVIGTGDIGRSTARIMSALGTQVRGVSRRGRPAEGFGQVFAAADLHAFLDGVDVLVIASPLTEATRGLVGSAELSLLRKGAYLVNVGRGPIVDEPALVAALRDGQLAGAALDVFDTEPLPEDSPLWAMPTVIVTPHNSDLTTGTDERCLALLADNLARFATGRPLRGVVDVALGY